MATDKEFVPQMGSKYCIANYEPVLFATRREFLAVYHEALLNLIGKTLDGYLLLYDERDNEWNKDAPAILLIDGKRYEFTAFQMDYFNLTIDAVDLKAEIDWYAEEERQYIAWRKNVIKWVNTIIGRRILGINLFNHYFDRISIIDEFPNRREYEDTTLAGIEFMVDKNTADSPYSFLQIYNNNDEIGIEVIHSFKN